MKKFLLGSVGLAAMLAGPAMAADMPIKAPPPPPVAYYDWSGAYIGFNAGGVWNEVNRTFKVGGAVNPNFGTNDSDGIFGFHAGAQWQWGAWVLGVEAALSGCFKECVSNTGTLPVAAGFAANTSAQHKLTNLFTVGPRLGYAWDRWMLFATGGGLRPTSRERIARPSPALATVPAPLPTGHRATTAGMSAAASTTWSTRARWST